MKKLFLFDIDGTILDGARGMFKVSEKTIYAFRQLAKDNYVLLASGRCKGLLEKQILDLPVNGYILCNGAYVELDGKQIYAEYFNDNVVNKIIDYTSKNNGFYVFETLNHMYASDLNAPHFIKFLNTWGKPLEDFEQRPVLSGKYHVAMIGFVSQEDCAKCEQELGSHVSLARHNGYKSFDVNIAGINKGVGVKKVIEYLNIDINDTYCFGDGINDLEMLQAVGHPVIMKNANEKLKTYGFEETDDVLDDGVYSYLLANKLIKPLYLR